MLYTNVDISFSIFFFFGINIIGQLRGSNPEDTFWPTARSVVDTHGGGDDHVF